MIEHSNPNKHDGGFRHPNKCDGEQPPSSTPSAPVAFPGDLKGPKPITTDEVAIVSDPTPHLADYINQLHIIEGPNGMCMCGTDGKTCQELLAEASQEVRDSLLMLNLVSATPLAQPVAVVPPQTPQICATTLTRRYKVEDCKCDTYEGNLGPCLTFERGANEYCAYCDHSLACHHKAARQLEQERDEAREEVANERAELEQLFHSVNMGLPDQGLTCKQLVETFCERCGESWKAKLTTAEAELAEADALIERTTPIVEEMDRLAKAALLSWPKHEPFTPEAQALYNFIHHPDAARQPGDTI